MAKIDNLKSINVEVELHLILTYVDIASSKKADKEVNCVTSQEIAQKHDYKSIEIHISYTIQKRYKFELFKK